MNMDLEGLTITPEVRQNEGRRQKKKNSEPFTAENYKEAYLAQY